MADMFGDDFSGQEANEDPAAEFLAQQENELAGLESDVMGIDLSPQTQFNGIVENGLANFSDANDDGMFGTPVMNGDRGSPAVDAVRSDVYAAFSTSDVRPEQFRVEPEKIRAWRESNDKLIAEKDRDSEKRQREWLSLARKELEDWEKNRNEQLSKTKQGNRTAEAQFVKERDFKTPGTDWERISKLCDFNPKSLKGHKDVNRMRSTLLHLKQHPRAITITEVNGD